MDNIVHYIVMRMNMIVHLIIKNMVKMKYVKICHLYKVNVFGEFKNICIIIIYYKKQFFVYITILFLFCSFLLLICRVELTKTRTRTVLFFVYVQRVSAVCVNFFFYRKRKPQDENNIELVKNFSFLFLDGWI